MVLNLSLINAFKKMKKNIKATINEKNLSKNLQTKEYTRSRFIN